MGGTPRLRFWVRNPAKAGSFTSIMWVAAGVNRVRISGHEVQSVEESLRSDSFSRGLNRYDEVMKQELGLWPCNYPPAVPPWPIQTHQFDLRTKPT
jgi:hypothetical protein